MRKTAFIQNHLSSSAFYENLFTRAKKIGTARQIFGTVPRLPVPRLLPGGSLGTPKILSTGTTSSVGPIRLHVEIGRAVPIFLARVNGV